MQAPCWKCGASPTNAPGLPESEAMLSSLELDSATYLLHSNDAPLASEIPGVRHIVSAERNRIERLQTEILELQKALERRMQELEETKASLKNHTAILSAVRRVPAEIICEIFSYTLPCTRRVNGLDTQQAPWRLGHICRQWRATVLGYPPLWSSIAVHASWDDDTYSLAMVETHLRRSANASLAVTLDCKDGQIKSSNFSKSIDLILRHSTHWVTLSLRLHHLVAARILARLRPAMGRLPALRTLEFVEVTKQYRTPDSSLTGDTFSIAPALQKVFLTREPFHNVALTADLQLSWSQLTHFRGTWRFQEDGLNILRSTPNVVECGITIVGRDSLPPGSTHVALPNLRRLSIDAHGGFLELLRAPLLQELWITGDTAHYYLRPFIQHSSCTLVKLVMDDCSDPPWLAMILPDIPTLTTLYIAFSDKAIAKVLFDALKITGGPSDILPNLTHLAAGGSSGFGINAFVNMAATRWYKGTPRLSFMRTFYRLDVSSSSSAFKDVVSLIEKMRGEGLDAGFDTGFRPEPRNYFGLGCP
ncbi:hypothetical protein MVEN_00622600 [Mycena venus]|uniref:F-box domain-containing protein n=1 Tax=Mycena venus TaxID=2733690 RepID=A0A8H6YK76_9AGAR|nr:hypothetical protein MVEN_00622600 [Mycena venus]